MMNARTPLNGPSLHQILADSGWEAQFDTGTFERALDYVRRSRVLDLREESLDADHNALIGVVRGSAVEPYISAVVVRRGRHGLHADSQCTCPVGVRCKHVAAVLIAASSFSPAAWPKMDAAVPQRSNARRAPVPFDPWERWLRMLEAPSAGSLREAEPQRSFAVLLRASEEATPRLLATPVWMRPGKTRALVDPQPLMLDDDGPHPTPLGGWPDTDADALATLLHERYERLVGLPWKRIHTAYQERALLSLASRYPVFFEKAANGAFTAAEPLPLRLGWRDEADGSQRLVADVDAGDGTLLLRGAGLWYVQPAARRFGRVDGNVRALDLVRHAPPLQPEQVASLRKRLRKAPPAMTLPEPTDRGPVRLIETTPVPVLRLRVIEPPRYARSSGPVGCARLAFDYADLLLALDSTDGPVRRLRDGRVLELRRDTRAERRALARLEQAGLKEARAVAYDSGLLPHALTDGDFMLRPHRRRAPLPEAWASILRQLGDQGFRIEYEPGFPHDDVLDVDAWHAEITADGNIWFDVALGIEVGGERIDLLPILRRVLADPAFPLQRPRREKPDAAWRVALDAERSVELPLARLRILIEPLLEWLEGDATQLRLHRTQAEALLKMGEAAHLPWRGDDTLRTRLTALRDAPRAVDAPPGFAATLRPYQREGLAWLNVLADAGLGGVLADDMGLGKTVQVLAHLLAEKRRGRLADPAPVVAPTSLVGNWLDEAARFAPDLRTLVLHGADRASRYDAIAEHDLVITTYPLLPRDRERLLDRRFALLVLDEAQAIKNARSQTARVVRELDAARRLAMTGTPLENHLGELWAQFDAVEPGVLGSERQFARLYRTPIEKHGDTERRKRLNRRIAPLLLRRCKDDVLADLPAKTEIVRTLELEDDQRALYESLRLAQHERVREAVAQRGIAQSGIVVLDALLKLRQVCCDPRLVKLDSAKKIKRSVKLDALLELLPGLAGEGRRVLLFSQFTEMLGLIETALRQRGIAWQTLTGQTPARERTALVRRFQNGEVPVFLISLKAGGVGLNLTAADTVIHYDPWWNPAVEAQATDRAHRIGQDKPVFVYKLICAGTVEEKIQTLQTRKAKLAQAVLEGEGGGRLRIDEADIDALFAPL